VPRPWGEGSRTEIEERFATKRAREGRLASAGEVWSERLARALDALGLEGHELERRYIHLVLAVVPDVEHVRPEEWDDLVRLHGGPPPPPRVNPFFGADRETRDRALRQLWSEYGEKAGIGPPPDDFFGD
jgi:hypothetical protein